MKTVGLFNDTSVSGHYGCTAVMSVLTGALRSRGLQPTWWWPVAEPWQPHEAWLDRHLPEMIVVNGEGTIHHSADRQRTRDLLAVSGFAKARGVPVHLVNASIAALDEPAIAALRDFDTIHVREGESRDYLAGHGIDARIVPDLSLGFDYRDDAGPRSGILVTDSVFRDTSRALEAFATSTGASFEKMKPRLSRIDRWRDRLAAHLSPVPAARRWRPRSDPAAFADRLARSELVVTGRFHTVLLSLATGTPFLALPSNTRKIEAVLTDCFGDTTRMIDLETLSDPAFQGRAGAGAAFTTAERSALDIYLQNAKTARTTMFDRICGNS